MIDMVSEKQTYDLLYSHHSPSTRCPVAVDSLPKARKRVQQVLRIFGISSRIRGMKVLDVGCGLGYIAEALRLEGAHVVAVDMSDEGIRFAKQAFPKVDFRCLVFPDAFQSNERFDLVLSMDISTLNTFDVDEMNRQFFAPAMKVLKPDGSLIVGRHSDFSGRVMRNYTHWPLRTIRALRKLGFSEPRVVQARFSILSWITIWTCKAAKKSCPIFLIRQNRA